MKKYLALTVALVVVGWAMWQYLPAIQAPRGLNATSSAPLLPSFTVPSFKLPALESAPLKALAWNTWGNYRAAAKAHDLEKLKGLSHQLSPACADALRESECFNLMDSVYALTSDFKLEDFQYIEADAKQIIMYTDGPDRKILYFTREGNALKVLGVRFCMEDDEDPGLTCADLNADTRDDDADGWWNSTESLFR
jgi:hypothetical protein